MKGFIVTYSDMFYIYVCCWLLDKIPVRFVILAAYVLYYRCLTTSILQLSLLFL